MRKNLMKAAGILLLFFWGIIVTGCDPLNSSDDSSSDNSNDNNLTVSMAVKNKNGTTTTYFDSDEPIVCTATVSGASGTVSYLWYLDGKIQPDADADTVKGHILASVQGTHSVSVRVTDSNTSATDYKSVSISPGASLFVDNESSSPIISISEKLSAYSTWHQLLSYGETVQNNYVLQVWGFSSGTYDIEIENSSYRIGDITDRLMSAGSRTVITFYDSYTYVKTVSNNFAADASTLEGGETVPPEALSGSFLVNKEARSIIAEPLSSVTK